MKTTVSIIIGLIGFLAGQGLIFAAGKPALGVAVTIAMLAIAALYYWEPWKNAKRAVKSLADNLPAVLAAFAVLLAVTATAIVRPKPVLALWLYAASGIILLLAKPAGQGLFQQGNLSLAAAPLQKWEPLFLILFILYAGALRLVALNDIPAGIYGHELIQLSEAEGFPKGAYVWHMGSGAEWPTVTVYQGVLFAKMFGWNVGSFRIEGAIWGLGALIAFYFLARALTSPLIAAAVSVMLASNAVHILISRNLIASPILMAGSLLAMGLMIGAIRTGKWYFYLAAGMALGLGLHGYMPGRILPVVFGIWMLGMLIFYRKQAPTWKGAFIFAGGFLIVAGPILYLAFKNPGIYWGYFQSVNPNRQAGVSTYFNTFFANLPRYAEMFHISADTDIGMHVPCKNIFDQVIGTLFPMGLFLCFAMFFRPVPAYLLIFFWLCMIPGIMGSGHSPHPNIRRIVLAIPAAYLMGAFVLDRLRLVYAKYNNSVLRICGTVLLVLLTGWTAFYGLKEYFVEATQNKEFRAITGYCNYLAGMEMKKNKDARIVLTPLYNSGLSLPRGITYDLAMNPEELLILDGSRDNLLLIEPFLESVVPFFRDNFAGADIKVYDEPKENRKEFCTSFKVDEYNDFTYLYRIKIPAQDAKKFQSLIDAGTGEPAMHSDADFSQRYAGKKVRLKGALIIKDKEQPVNMKINWPGWVISTETGKSKGSAMISIPGVNYFELEGIVPAGASGPLPLELAYITGGNPGAGRIVGIKGNYGLKMRFAQGMDVNPKTYAFEKNILFPVYRMHDGYTAGLNVPFTAVFTADFTAPAQGDYSIKPMDPAFSRVIAGKKVLSDNIPQREPVAPVSISLRKDEKIKLEFYFICHGGTVNRTMILKMTGPAALLPENAPYTAFTRR